MKKILSLFTFLLFISQAYSIAGFGLQVGQSMFSVEENSPTMSNELLLLTNGAFENAFNIGGYLYLDVIPVVDIEVDFSAQANTYNIQFENASGSMDPLDFGWASTDLYFTVRKKLFGFKIPFIAKAKLFAGGGYNTHTTTPLASEDMITDLLGGDINNDVSNLDNSLEDYLSDSDNYLTSSGYHLQGGLQFKLFLLDTFVFYRQVFVEDVIPDAKGFGSMNLRIGMGF